MSRALKAVALVVLAGTGSLVAAPATLHLTTPSTRLYPGGNAALTLALPESASGRPVVLLAGLDPGGSLLPVSVTLASARELRWLLPVPANDRLSGLTVQFVALVPNAHGAAPARSNPVLFSIGQEDAPLRR